MNASRLIGRLLCLVLPGCGVPWLPASHWNLDGVVVDEHGHPMSGVSCTAVGFHQLIDSQPSDSRPCRTSRDGRFRLRVSDRHEEILLVCQADGYVTGLSQVQRDQGEVRVQLAPGGHVAGTILVDDDIDLESLEVVLDGGEAWRELVPFGGPIAIELNDDGRFRSADPAPPGVATLRISSREHQRPILERPVTVVAREETRMPDVDLRGAMAEITITAVDPTGSPLTGFDLTLVTGAGQRTTYADADAGTGARRILVPRTALPLRDVRVAAAGRRTAVLGDVWQDTAARLEPAIEVGFRFSPPLQLTEGETLYLLAIKPEPAEFVRCTLGADGVAKLHFPTPGSWTLHATFIDGSGPQVPFDLLDDGSKPTITVEVSERGPRTLVVPSDAVQRARDMIADTHERRG